MIRFNEDSTRIKKAIYGDITGKIKSFAIITGENPLGVNLKSGNKERNKKLLDLAKQYKIQEFDKINGYFGGNTEHSFVFYNISLGETKELAAIFMQRSFFYGKLPDIDEVSLNSGRRNYRAEITYYETDYESDDISEITAIDRSNLDKVKYKFIESYYGAEIVDNKLDFHSSRGDFSFTIPLKYFESLDMLQPKVVDVNSLNKCLNEKYTIHRRVQYRALAYNGKQLN